MQKNSLSYLTALGLMTGVFLLNHTLPRLPASRLRAVPIQRLPRRIHDWRSDTDVPLDASIYLAVPDAMFLSREYHRSNGEVVQLLLETSTDAQMFHSPTQCLPAQNWTILSMKATRVHPATPPGIKESSSEESTSNDPTATEMFIQNGAERAVMLYWYTTERQLDKWENLKTHLTAGRQPTRLFVRILVLSTVDAAQASSTAHAFASNILKDVHNLEKM